MASHFHKLRVKQVVPETEHSVLVSFEVPTELQSTFAFTQGQHLTLRTHINGQELRRNYSLCSSPLDGEWKIAIKRVVGGTFSNWANTSLKAGMEIDVMPPTGHFFTPLHSQQRKQYLAIAAGSGITPIISIIKTTLLTEPQSSFTLIYGNRNKNSIIFREALERLKDAYMSRFRLIHILSREQTEADINHGRIDATKCETLAASLINLKKIDECFLCGPEQMILDAKQTLVAAGLPAANVHFELFTSSVAHKPVSIVDVSQKDNQPTSQVTIRIDGVESSFPLAYLGNSILDAALHNGHDLPYACKGGVCCTCKAKLVEGKIDMDVVYGLEPDEIAAGYILTCQSHPRTPVVKVDYDL
ncbi:MAG TPA: 1,2-phenylacetyl-CoA epoxidase subunit PaaE [Phnomibacter sp.]|nr:1,2-phenylacetyl-CoA epoxidase subunit PaaE [Phnomibacter sp.]